MAMTSTLAAALGGGGFLQRSRGLCSCTSLSSLESLESSSEELRPSACACSPESSQCSEGLFEATPAPSPAKTSPTGYFTHDPYAPLVPTFTVNPAPTVPKHDTLASKIEGFAAVIGETKRTIPQCLPVTSPREGPFSKMPQSAKPRLGCEVCGVSCRSVVSMEAHMQGKAHQRKANYLQKCSVAVLFPATLFNHHPAHALAQCFFPDPCQDECRVVVTFETPEDAKRALQVPFSPAAKVQVVPLEQLWECPVCQMQVNSEKQLRQHLNSEKHLHALKAVAFQPANIDRVPH